MNPFYLTATCFESVIMHCTVQHFQFDGGDHLSHSWVGATAYIPSREGEKACPSDFVETKCINCEKGGPRGGGEKKPADHAEGILMLPYQTDASFIENF